MPKDRSHVLGADLKRSESGFYSGSATRQSSDADLKWAPRARNQAAPLGINQTQEYGAFELNRKIVLTCLSEPSTTATNGGLQ
jgi:hypothetical protein